MIDDWIYKVIDKQLYTVQHFLVTVLWNLNQSLLYLVYLIDQARTQLATGGFVPALTTISGVIAPYVTPLMALGLTLWLLLVILQPIIDVRLVDIRKLALLVVLAPTLLVSSATIYGEFEQIRADFGDTLYSEVFPTVGFTSFVPAAPVGSEPDVLMGGGKIAQFDPDATGLHGIDVAAAYLLATQDDVLRPTTAISIPNELQRRFFTVDPSNFQTLEASDRQTAIEQAGLGITRQLYGVLLSVFALTESLTHLIFALGLGFLFFGLTLALGLAWFSPVEHIATNLAHQVIRLFIASCMVSLLSAVIMGLLLKVGESGNASAILGVGIAALCLQIVLLINAGKAAFSALVGVAAATSGGAVSDQDAATTLRSVGRGAVGGGIGALSGGVGAVQGVERGLGATGRVLGRGAGLALGGAAAYSVARRATGSRGYATGYVAGGSRRLARIGALAQAMGVLHPDRNVAQGLYTSVVMGNHNPLHLRAQRQLHNRSPQRHASGGAGSSTASTVSGTGASTARSGGTGRSGERSRARPQVRPFNPRVQAARERAARNRTAPPPPYEPYPNIDNLGAEVDYWELWKAARRRRNQGRTASTSTAGVGAPPPVTPPTPAGPVTARSVYQRLAAQTNQGLLSNRYTRATVLQAVDPAMDQGHRAWRIETASSQIRQQAQARRTTSQRAPRGPRDGKAFLKAVQRHKRAGQRRRTPAV